MPLSLFLDGVMWKGNLVWSEGRALLSALHAMMVPYGDIISIQHGQNVVDCQLNPTANGWVEIADLLQLI